MSTPVVTTPVDHAARVRELQNAKAHQVRLDNLGKRDPLIRALLKDYRQHVTDLAAAKATLASQATELDRVTTQAADEATQLRTALDSSQAEVAKLRGELAAALKKPPAGK